jgi:hypothetical protein
MALAMVPPETLGAPCKEPRARPGRPQTILSDHLMVAFLLGALTPATLVV